MNKPIEKILKLNRCSDMLDVIIQSFINKPVKTTAWEDLCRNQNFLKGMLMELSAYIRDETFPIEDEECYRSFYFKKGGYFMYALLLNYGLI